MRKPQSGSKTYMHAGVQCSCQEPSQGMMCKLQSLCSLCEVYAVRLATADSYKKAALAWTKRHPDQMRQDLPDMA